MTSRKQFCLPEVGNQEEEHHWACIFTDTHSCTANGSYVAQIAFQAEVPDFWQIAPRQIRSLNRRLVFNSDLWEKYVAFMKE